MKMGVPSSASRLSRMRMGLIALTAIGVCNAIIAYPVGVKAQQKDEKKLPEKKDDKTEVKKDDKKPPVLPPTKVEVDPKKPVEPPLIQPPVIPDAPFPPTSAPPGTSPTGTPPINATSAAGIQTINSVVNGGIFGSLNLPGYGEPSQSTGAKIDIPTIDYPGMVTTITKDLIRDQQALRVDDLLRDIPSAVKLGDFRRDSFLLRGFEVRSRDYRWNGFVDPGNAPRDMANVERIEVLQGPSSFLYGAGSPSGLINFVTKKPLPFSYNAANYQVGNYGLQRGTVDSTGPINEKGTLLYRVNVAYEDRGSFRDFGFGERVFAAPVVTWVLDDYTSFSVEGSYLNDRRRYDTSLALNGGQNNLPINRSLNEPNDFQRFNDYKVGAFFTRQFGEESAFRIGGFATWYDMPSVGAIPGPNPLGSVPLPFQPPPFGNPPAPFVNRNIQEIPDLREQYYSIISDLNLTADVFGMKNRFLVGGELGWFRATDFTANQKFTLDPNDPFVPNPFGPPPPFLPNPAQFNMENPQYGNFDPLQVAQIKSAHKQERYGIYLQDFLEVNEYVNILAGVRFNKITTDLRNTVDAAGIDAGTHTDSYAALPRVGLVVSPIPNVLSFYGSYSEGFDFPISGVFVNPQTLKPETSRGAEGGMILSLFQNRFNIIATGYHIEKNNVLTFASNDLTTAFQVGQIRSKGFEFSAIGQINERWGLVANYAYTDSRTTADIVPSIVGKQFRNVPFNAASMWSRYNVIANQTHTLGLAGGLVYVGERSGDLADTFQLPGYTRWDGGIYYQRGALNVGLYAENIFDMNYFLSSVDQYSIAPGAPATVRMNVGFVF